MGLYVLKYPSRRLLRPLSRALAGVHPDILSYLATAVTVATALCYVYAADRPGLLVAAVALTLVRMTLNTLDGPIAIQRGNLSLKGEIVNALPDRYSDLLLVGGIALSPLCLPAFALLGLSSMLLVSYTGMLGKALGVDWQHHGPLGKVERLICIMVFSLLQCLLLRTGVAAWTVFGWSLTPLECCMILFVVLGQITVLNRVRGMLRQIACLEWKKRGSAGDPHLRALVTYESRTGNTAKVATAIAECLGADLKRIGEGPNPDGYDLVVVGRPTVSSRPTGKILQFLVDRTDRGPSALFTTYGAPVIGPRTARKALTRMTEAMGTEPVATFACKGRHALVRWLHKSRPNGDDLLSASLFGIQLAKKLGR